MHPSITQAQNPRRKQIAPGGVCAGQGFEVILEPGDALYIPSFWLHYIVSLGTNFQCNARSGHSEVSHEDLKVCGF